MPAVSVRRFGPSDQVLLGTVVGLLLVSLGLAALLALMIWRAVEQRAAIAGRTHAAGTAPAPPGEGAGAAPGESLRADSTAAGQPARSGWQAAGAIPGDAHRPDPAGIEAGSAAPLATRPPVVPVSYPRWPSFSASLASLELDQALAQSRSAAHVLETLPLDALAEREAIRSWSQVQDAVGRAWPRLDAVTRRALLERSVELVRRIEDMDTAEAFMAPLLAGITTAPDSVAAIRRGAWSAGLLGALLSEPGLAPEVVSIIARSRLAPADGAGDAFARFSAAWLDQQLAGIVDRTLTGSPQEDFDRFEAWIEAQAQVRPPAEAQEAWLRAIDMLLHRPLRFDLPGTASDLLGRFLSMVDWKVTSPGARSIQRRMEQWMRDPTLPASRLWALGSILRQQALAPWFSAAMVVGERDSLEEREERLALIRTALGDHSLEFEPLARLPKELVARWERLAAIARAEGDSAAPIVVPAVRREAWPRGAGTSRSEAALQELGTLVRLMEIGGTGALIAAGRSAEASQRLAELERSMEAPMLGGLGPGGRSLPAPAEPSGDGVLARRLDEVRTAADRVEAIRRRRTEAAPDLGPVDAARLVREAYLGEPAAVRLTAQGVIVDSFAAGRRVAQELVDQFALAGGADLALARFVERLTGERMPPHTNPSFRAAALAALLRHRLRLSEHPWHGVDALAARAAVVAAERLEAEGGAPEALRDAADPISALQAHADLLRARAGSRIAMQPIPDALERLDHRDEARRALADSTPQRLAAALWRLLELELYLTAADRPSLRGLLGGMLEQAQREFSSAPSIIQQSIALERARVRLIGARLALDSGGSP